MSADTGPLTPDSHRPDETDELGQPDAPGSGPLAAVDLEPAADDQWTLVFVRVLRHPPAEVWAALTDPARLGAWAPFESDRDLGTPGDVTLTLIDGETREPLPAKVLRAEAPSLLEYTWGTDLLRWELVPAPDGTRLTLRHTLADRDMAPKVAAGWHICLAVADRLLDGRPVPPIRGRDALNYGWDELRAGYGKELGGG